MGRTLMIEQANPPRGGQHAVGDQALNDYTKHRAGDALVPEGQPARYAVASLVTTRRIAIL
jgi:hypothetical protein